MASFLGDRPDPLGFGDCGDSGGPRCPYWARGSSQVCWPCAKDRIRPPPEGGCSVCAHPLTADHPTCPNRLCHDPNRAFRRVHALGIKDGELERVLLRYKRAHGWAPVLARLLTGWLDDRLLEVGDTEWDLITAVPHADGEQGRAYSPGQLILRLARDEDSFYPFDASPPPVIVKTSPTPMMTPLGAQDREASWVLCRPHVGCGSRLRAA